MAERDDSRIRLCIKFTLINFGNRREQSINWEHGVKLIYGISTYIWYAGVLNICTFSFSIHKYSLEAMK